MAGDTVHEAPNCGRWIRVYKLGPLVERMRNFTGMFGNGSFFCFKKLGFRDENQKKSSVELKCKIPLECGKQKAMFWSK